jgi:LCP family protein required for cell wall assembly
MTELRPPRPRWFAAILSFLFPGLGQAYAGQWQIALLLAVPVLLVLLLVISAFTVLAGRLSVDVFSSSFILGLLALDVALFGWRAFAIAHAGLGGHDIHLAGRAGHDVARSHRRFDMGVVALLLVATVGMHAYAGIVLRSLDQTLGDVFGGQTDGGTTTPDGTTDHPINEPDYHWDGTDRVNFLLLGIDSGPGRQEALTDTILVVSVDPTKGSAVMISVPRDTGNVPLPDRSIFDAGVYPDKINALSTVASNNPGLWCPDLSSARTCGLRTLERSVGLYLGIKIQYVATVDLAGFAELIDALGGVNLCLPGKLVDPTYTSPGSAGRGIELPAGCHAYTGHDALAYARIRKGWIEMPDGTIDYQNDFERADRQQKVLLALRSELADANLVFELPGILEAIGRTVSTDFPRGQAGNLASLLPLISGPEIDRVVLGYPEFVDPPADPNTNYLLLPKRDAIRAEMTKLFGAAALEGWYMATEDPLPPLEAAPIDDGTSAG